MKTKTLGALALAFLLFALFGCAQPAVQTSRPTDLAASLPNSSSKTATVSPVATITATIQKTATPKVTVTNTPILSTPTSVPLSQTGPWLMVYNRIDTGRGYDRNLLTEPILTNVDGSAWERANLPYDPKLDQPEPRRWFGRIDTKGPYIALREDLNLVDFDLKPYSPTCDEVAYRPDETGRYNKLYILMLPDNKIVNQFRLFGEKAIDQFRKEECEYAKKGTEELPPVLGTILNSTNFQWSPDGRYLAFTAAPDFPFADLYLYDTKDNLFRRLTTSQNNPNFIHWSQDGKTIIYNSTTKMSISLKDQWESQGVYGVSIEGNDSMLFAPKDYPYFIGWYSLTQFLMEDGFCDAWGSGLCTTNIRLIDLSTGGNTIIYSNPSHYYHFAVDPIHHVLLIQNPPFELSGKERTVPTPYQNDTQEPNLTGVYQFDLNTRKVNRLLDGNVNILEWNPKFQSFRVVFDYDTPSDLRSVLLNFEPGKGWVEKPDDIFILSPDGQWSVREGLVLTDNQGYPVQKVEDFSGCFSPSSDTYAEMIHDYKTSLGQLLIYVKQRNWQPYVARSINTDQFWFCTWISP